MYILFPLLLDSSVFGVRISFFGWSQLCYQENTSVSGCFMLFQVVLFLMQFYDLLNIFELNGLPSEENPYLFNGDFVDRGSFSLEVILTLFAFKCMCPSGKPS